MFVTLSIKATRLRIVLLKRDRSQNAKNGLLVRNKANFEALPNFENHPVKNVYQVVPLTAENPFRIVVLCNYILY